MKEANAGGDPPEETAKYEKGDRAKVLPGVRGAGTEGQVFWIGPNKYGPGLRFGLRGDDGQTYWLDELQIGDAGPAPAPGSVNDERSPQNEAPAGPVLDKGSQVEIPGGIRGEIFWSGQNKFGVGMRYGVRSDDGQTHWVDGGSVKAIEGEQAGNERPGQHSAAQRSTSGGGSTGAGGTRGGGGSTGGESWADGSPLPEQDAGPSGGAMPAAFDDVPLPDDDEVWAEPADVSPFPPDDDLPF